MDEIWNIGLFIQIALIENIRDICEYIYSVQMQKAKVENILSKFFSSKIKIPASNVIGIIRPTKMRNSFIEYMAYKLKKFGRQGYAYFNILEDEVNKTGATIEEIVKEFERVGYTVKYDVLNAVNYGVPQQRRRIFVIGTLDKENKFNFPEKTTKQITIAEALKGLPKLESGETSDIPNHNAMNHSKQMLEKMSYVKDGGNRNDIPEDIRPKSGDIRKYIRYNSNEPSICITGDMRKVFHFNQNRALTGRELARIQTFPDDFIFKGNAGKVQQQIGNAVPPKLAFQIANSVKEVLDNE